MATATARPSSRPLPPQAILNAARLSAQKKRINPRAEPNLVPKNFSNRDPRATFNAERHQAKRFSNPQLMMPSYAAQVTEYAQQEQEEDAQSFIDEENEYMADIAEESTQADDLSLLNRARSQIKNKKDELVQQSLQRAKEELNNFTAKVTDVTAKTASAADIGEMGEVADTLGTGWSIAHVTTTIFDSAFSPEQKKALGHIGLAPLSLEKAWDIFSLTGAVMQIQKWSLTVMVILPFLIIFLVMMAYQACKNDLPCGMALGLKNLLLSLFGT